MQIEIRQNKLDLFPLCFHALSDPIRLKLLELLSHQELCVTDLCDFLNIKQPKISFHLKILKDSGLVFTRQQGRSIYYRINHSQFNILKQYLESQIIRQCQGVRW
ncbi:helix-turn-helix transcriptional regulator [Geminocystis sp. NIES-3709]|uniref:ArsR/SmtB family transcription factor n=1 Tax=Geminocystis sp. NIES-3709 TaxID=1617448 RepID=UPI000826A6F3|nr:metalloregulator ArsR/SmtB family transcription factor [Geminocystis sp. NIES-3709]